jgi:hypothetical protein
MVTRYFIFPKSEVQEEIKLKSKNQMKALSKTDGIYQRMGIESVGSFKSDKQLKGKLEEPEDNEAILDLIKTFYPCAHFTHNMIEYAVVKGIVPQEAIESFGKFSGKAALSQDSLTDLGLADVIVASDEKGLIDHVLAKYGIDLSGEHEVGLDMEGNTTMAPWIIPVKMLGEQ